MHTAHSTAPAYSTGTRHCQSLPPQQQFYSHPLQPPTTGAIPTASATCASFSSGNHTHRHHSALLHPAQQQPEAGNSRQAPAITTGYRQPGTAAKQKRCNSDTVSGMDCGGGQQVIRADIRHSDSRDTAQVVYSHHNDRLLAARHSSTTKAVRQRHSPRCGW